MVCETVCEQASGHSAPRTARHGAGIRTSCIGAIPPRRRSANLSEHHPLLDVERNQKHVTCRLNLEPLLKLDAYGETQKAEKKARDADRAAKAREAREDQRTEQNVRTLYAKGLAEIRQERQPLTTALVQRLAEGPALTPEQQTKLDAYLAAQGKADEYGLKIELLKDMRYPNIRRTMLTWDVERIRRAKTNAEALMCNTPEAIAEP